VATALGDAGISIHRMRQYDHTDAQAPVLIVTHKATRDDVNDALARMSKTGVVLGDPVALRIEEV
jgi:homoserine dehydrogenase